MAFFSSGKNAISEKRINDTVIENWPLFLKTEMRSNLPCRVIFEIKTWNIRISKQFKFLLEIFDQNIRY